MSAHFFLDSYWFDLVLFIVAVVGGLLGQLAQKKGSQLLVGAILISFFTVTLGVHHFIRPINEGYLLIVAVFFGAICFAAFLPKTWFDDKKD